MLKMNYVLYFLNDIHSISEGIISFCKVHEKDALSATQVIPIIVSY